MLLLSTPIFSLRKKKISAKFFAFLFNFICVFLTSTLNMVSDIELIFKGIDNCNIVWLCTI